MKFIPSFLTRWHLIGISLLIVAMLSVREILLIKDTVDDSGYRYRYYHGLILMDAMHGGDYKGFIKVYWPNGQLLFRGNSKGRNHLDGLQTSYNDKGLVLDRWAYRNGVPEDGTRVRLWPNGQKRMVETIRNGKIVGTVTEWFPSGELAGECEYLDGVPMNGRYIKFQGDWWMPWGCEVISVIGGEQLGQTQHFAIKDFQFALIAEVLFRDGTQVLRKEYGNSGVRWYIYKNSEWVGSAVSVSGAVRSFRVLSLNGRGVWQVRNPEDMSRFLGGLGLKLDKDTLEVRMQ